MCAHLGYTGGMSSASLDESLLPHEHERLSMDEAALRAPTEALRFGFVNSPVGTHGSRTIILMELRLLFAACSASATLQDYRSAVIENNILLKGTAATRRESFRRLRELYALSGDALLFRALRELWTDRDAQPLLALLCACARDPLLRATAGTILITPLHAPVTPHMLSRAVDEVFPGRYNPTSLANIGRHTASSWKQSGHVRGRLRAIRSAAASQPTTVAYALLLGYLCGARGDALFETLWARLLDAPVYVLRNQAVAASHLGWIDYRHSGDVTDIGFRHFLVESKVGRPDE